MKRIFKTLGLVALSCTTLLAQQTSSSSLIDNEVLFDVTFDDNTANDHSSYHLQGRKNEVSIALGNANFNEVVNSSINYGMPSHLNNDGDFTVSLWYYGGSESIADYELIFQKGDLKIALHDVNTPLVSSKDNSIWDNTWTPNAYDFGTSKFKNGYSYKDKQHLVVTKKSDSLYFYRNNEFKGKSKYVANPNIDKVVRIGDHFSGSIDRVTIYDSALTTQEIETAFYYNINIPIPNTCGDNLLFEPIKLIRGEGNSFYSCGYEDDIYPNKNMFSLLDFNYGLIEGTAYLTYPNGLVVIKEFKSAEAYNLTEYGNYVLKFVTPGNCMIEKEFSFHSSPKKTYINILYPNTNILCNNQGVWIDYYIGNPLVKNDINGFEIYSYNYLSVAEQPLLNLQFETDHENNKILVDKPGTYQLTVDYGACKYISNTIEVIKCDEDILGVNNSEESTMSVYPNPTQGKLYLTNDKDVNSIEVYNMDGHQVLTLNPKNLDLSPLNNGVYLIKIVSKNLVTTQKIILE